MHEHSIKQLILGDESKYDYIKSLLDTKVKIQKNRDIIVIFGSAQKIDSTDERYVLRIPYICPGTLMYLPAAASVYGTEYDDYNSVLVFSEIPYKKEETINILKTLDCRCKCRLILYRAFRRFGFTDLDGEDELVIQARRELGKYCADVILYEEGERKIIGAAPLRLSEYIKIKYKREFNDKYASFKDRGYFDAQYSLLEKTIQDDPYMFDFEKVRDKGNNIWDIYINIFWKDVSDALKEEISAVFEYYLKNLIGGEALEEIIKDTYNNVNKVYFSSLKKNIKSKYYMPRTKSEYQTITNNKNLIASFKEKIKNEFNEKLKIICMDNLEHEFAKIKKELK